MSFALKTGQLTLGAAQQLTPTSRGVIAVGVYAPRSNTLNAYIGDSTVTSGTGYILEPGTSLDFDAIDPTLVWVLGTSPDIVSWAGVLPA